MAAEIKILPHESVTANYGESYMVMVGQLVIMQCADNHQAEFFARKLNMARESKLHTAMNILTEQCGLSESFAKALYHDLLTDGHQGYVN